MGFQFMLILGLLGMYFNAAMVFVTKSSLLFKLAVAILWDLNTNPESLNTNLKNLNGNSESLDANSENLNDLESLGRILSNISFVFWAMEFQENLLLRFTGI